MKRGFSPLYISSASLRHRNEAPTPPMRIGSSAFNLMRWDSFMKKYSSMLQPVHQTLTEPIAGFTDDDIIDPTKYLSCFCGFMSLGDTPANVRVLPYTAIMNERYVPDHRTLQSYFRRAEEQLPPHSYYQLHLCEKCFLRLSFEIIFTCWEEYEDLLTPPMSAELIYKLVVKKDNVTGYYGPPPLLLPAFKCGIKTATHFNRTFKAYTRFREQLIAHLFGDHPIPLSYVASYNPGTDLYESILRVSPATTNNAMVHPNQAGIVDSTDNQFPWCFCNDK